MSLPLRDPVTEERPYFAPPHGALPQPSGEQYRFHFATTKCIGCHCCEVACNEQNNNPAYIHWRRVGEIEGGAYPFTQRFYEVKTPDVPVRVQTYETRVENGVLMIAVGMEQEVAA